ncbi:uncharacterized protein LOC134211248 [Armigeres subalbatus]|uniref:uncharacterized protein LOC134211248 n=1 Tax=Armigeres subalbatus TaxID=124917 RepID=UPI002ED16A84
MTLRENSDHEIPPNRKFSVSQSGRFKSRSKIRPSLSGDMFRAEPVNTEEIQPKPDSTGDGVSHRTVGQLDGNGNSANSGNHPQQMHQTHSHYHDGHNLQHRPTREILETSL